MIFSGTAISVSSLGEGIVEFRFDLSGESINKLDDATLSEFDAATRAIAALPDLAGIVVSSAKKVFIVGADINEFGETFAKDEDDLAAAVLGVNRVLCRFEDLPVPKVAAINGICLGGGTEVALTCEYRVASTAARIGHFAEPRTD